MLKEMLLSEARTGRTYRTSKAFLLVHVSGGCAICAVFVGIGPTLLVAVVGTDDTFSSGWWGQLGFALVFMFFSIGAAVWIYGALDACYRIELFDDGWCEFRSLLRRRRLHAQQIVSVQQDEDEDFVRLRYRGGKVRIAEPDGFDDFLSRLRQLNPAVQVDFAELPTH
jgi:hypothetical protein